MHARLTLSFVAGALRWIPQAGEKWEAPLHQRERPHPGPRRANARQHLLHVWELPVSRAQGLGRSGEKQLREVLKQKWIMHLPLSCSIQFWVSNWNELERNPWMPQNQEAGVEFSDGDYCVVKSSRIISFSYFRGNWESFIQRRESYSILVCYLTVLIDLSFLINFSWNRNWRRLSVKSSQCLAYLRSFCFRLTHYLSSYSFRVAWRNEN